MNNLAYTAGTVSIPAGSLIATGAGVVWTDLRVQPFGFLWVPDTGQVFGIDTVTDATHLALINKNAGAAISAKPYVIISFPSEMQDSLNLQAIRAFLATASIVIYRTSDPTAGDGVDGTACIVNDGTNPLRVFTKAAGAWTRQRFEVRLTSYTVSTVPSAATVGAGTMIYVPNESGGAVPAFSDGTSWRRVTDRAVIS